LSAIQVEGRGAVERWAGEGRVQAVRGARRRRARGSDRDMRSSFEGEGVLREKGERASMGSMERSQFKGSMSRYWTSMTLVLDFPTKLTRERRRSGDLARNFTLFWFS
jgi:hypothetical protein